MSERRISDFGGLNTLADPHDIGLGSFVRLDNVYIDASSEIISRPGTRKLSDGVYVSACANYAITKLGHLVKFDGEAHSDLGEFLGTDLVVLRDSGVDYISTEAMIGQVGTSGKVEVCRAAKMPKVSVLAGDLEPGSYGLVCVEVSAVGGIPSDPVRVKDPGSLRISVETESDIYITTANGSVYYYLVTGIPGEPYEVSAGFSDRLGHPLGRQNLVPMVPGGVMAMVMGSLVTAFGNDMYYSEPFEFLVTDPIANVLSFPDPITTILAIGTTVFIGTTKEVFMATGDSPSKWVLSQVSGHGAVPRSGLLTTAVLPGDSRYQVLAVFTQTNGAVLVGSGDGALYNMTYALSGDTTDKVNGAWALSDYIYFTH